MILLLALACNTDPPRDTASDPELRATWVMAISHEAEPAHRERLQRMLLDDPSEGVRKAVLFRLVPNSREEFQQVETVVEAMRRHPDEWGFATEAWKDVWLSCGMWTECSRCGGCTASSPAPCLALDPERRGCLRGAPCSVPEAQQVVPHWLSCDPSDWVADCPPDAPPNKKEVSWPLPPEQ